MQQQPIILFDGLCNLCDGAVQFVIKHDTDEKFLFASGGNDNRLLKYSIANNKLLLADSFLLTNKSKQNISPTGIEIDDANGLLYVVTKDNNSLYIINLVTKIFNSHSSNK